MQVPHHSRGYPHHQKSRTGTKRAVFAKVCTVSEQLECINLVVRIRSSVYLLLVIICYMSLLRALSMSLPIFVSRLFPVPRIQTSKCLLCLIFPIAESHNSPFYEPDQIQSDALTDPKTS